MRKDKQSTIAYQMVKSWPVEEIARLYDSAGWWEESEMAKGAILPMIDGSFAFIIATDGDKTVAMGRAISDGASDAYIQDVVVLPAYRKLGIGKKIIESLARYCADKHIAWIGLVAEPGTTHFYQKLGFRELEGYIPMRFPTKEIP
jgi:aralkylamine N-acetyltransferase